MRLLNFGAGLWAVAPMVGLLIGGMIAKTGNSVLLIIGPTAAGKSRVAAYVAERAGAEIISADARAIYRGLAIGTDRPPAELLERVPHHLIGILDPRAVSYTHLTLPTKA